MALSAVKTFSVGEVLTASDLNALNTNILNNPLSLISPLTGDLDGGDNEVNNVSRFGAGTSSPSAPGHFTDTDTRTATVVANLVVGGDTTGTPAAGIGTGILVQAESADEVPSDFGQIEFAASDIGAGTEDTYMQVLLRVAGAALTSCYRWVATGAFNAIFTHANSAARTYTLPDADTTFIGTDETATLTNKTLDAPVFSGTATGTYTLGGTPTITNPSIGGAVITGAAPSTPVANTLYTDSIVKVWLVVAYTGGVPAIQNDLNVVSISDDGTGVVGVTIETDFADALYAMSGETNGFVSFSAKAAGTFTMVIRDTAGSPADASGSCLAIGDQ